MHKSPAFQLYASDFLTDVAHLTNEEVGAYFRLLCHQWINGGIDLNRAYAVACADPENFGRIWQQIGSKFVSDSDGIIRNSRLEMERKKQIKFSRLQSLRARKRWIKKRARRSMPAHMPDASRNDALHTSVYIPPIAPHSGGGGFDVFWEAYPRKKGKGAAVRAWNKIHPDAELQARILQAVETEKSSAQWQRDGGKFIPHPATWLNQTRWEDEPATPSLSQEDGAWI